MIQITYRTKEDENSASLLQTIAIPEVLACSRSSRLRDLCARSNGRVFTADNVVGKLIDEFEEQLLGNNFHAIMTSFVKWLYGSDLDGGDRVWSLDRWFFGQRLGSPTFQNANRGHLCERRAIMTKQTLIVYFRKGLDMMSHKKPGPS
jgi:hypothetical protein